MQKRSEACKQEKVFFRTKLKHTAILMLCIIFALSTIYAVDISTYKLVNNDKDLYAMRVSRESVNMIRVDIAGTKYHVDIQNVKSYAGKLTEKTKGLIEGIKQKIQ